MDSTALPITHESPSWPGALRRYVLATFGFHALWEVAQLPLYTIWTTGTVQERWFAVAHCTLGDVVIASVSLFMALAIAGSGRWPRESFGRVAAMTMATGVAYTLYSEWINMAVRKAWAYAPLMPTLPPLGTGLTPLLQWVVVPGVALWFARRVAG